MLLFIHLSQFCHFRKVFFFFFFKEFRFYFIRLMIFDRETSRLSNDLECVTRCWLNAFRSFKSGYLKSLTNCFSLFRQSICLRYWSTRIRIFGTTIIFIIRAFLFFGSVYICDKWMAHLCDYFCTLNPLYLIKIFNYDAWILIGREVLLSSLSRVLW